MPRRASSPKSTRNCWFVSSVTADILLPGDRVPNRELDGCAPAVGQLDRIARTERDFAFGGARGAERLAVLASDDERVALIEGFDFEGLADVCDAARASADKLGRLADDE